MAEDYKGRKIMITDTFDNKSHAVINPINKENRIKCNVVLQHFQMKLKTMF